MKILFCTNVFEVVENGPVKFANLLLRINALYPEHELRILTEDTARARPFVHEVEVSRRIRKSPFSQFARMWLYHRAAMRLREDFPFDVLVYNHALVGLWSACRFGNTVGMVNDDNNLLVSRQGGTFGLKPFVFGRVERLTARKLRKVIVNSDYLQKTLAENYRIPLARVRRLYKAVETPVRSEAPPRPAEWSEPIRVLFVKNDHQRGGLAVLAEALGRLPYRFALTIAGPNQADRERILSSLGQLPNVEGVFVGKIPQPIVMKLLQETHLFCVPSQREALGVANLEAMAQGVPVVSTAVGGIPEVLDHGRCGWLVPPNDAEALAEALAECISKPRLRLAKTENAHRQARNFDTRTMFENFLKILAD